MIHVLLGYILYLDFSKLLKLVFLIVLMFFFNTALYSQEKTCNCNTTHPIPSNECNWILSRIVDVENPTSGNPQAGYYNIDFVFDNFSKYIGGVTVNGGTILKLIVEDNPSSSGTCAWKLNMSISNGGTVPATEWNTLTSYGSGTSSPKPTLDLLNMRIDNACSTPYLPAPPEKWRQPFSSHNQSRAIIDPTTYTAIVSGTACSPSEANGVASYLSADYHDMTFIIDYKIKPDLGLAPGKYSVVVKYCLTEQ